MRAKFAIGLIISLTLLAGGRAAGETLPLSPGLIGLDSDEGEALLFGAEAREDYLPLSLQFVTQQNQAFCGVASMVMVLNALNIGAPEPTAWKPFTAFNQENFFSAKTEAVVPRAVIERMGMTLTELGGLPVSFDLASSVNHASDSTIEDFRHRARDAIATDDSFLIINYLRSAIGQEKYGHISPLAAYDEDSDRFLILDVSRYKYPPVWVETATLFAAMNTPDRDNENKSRGFVIVSR